LSKIAGKIGKGTVLLSRRMAELWVREGNSKCPDILHYALPVRPSEPEKETSKCDGKE
jgi:hypothetical protein